MRSAPPVLVPVGRFVWGPRVVAGLALATGLACGWAAWWQGITMARAAAVAATWGGCAVVAWWVMRSESLPAGELAWDGQSWWFRESQGLARPVEVALQWDAGRAMLLRLRFGPTDRLSRHAWLQASQMPMLWHGLRCAVHAGDTL